MSEPKTVQPFLLGNTGKVRMDFRPVSMETAEPEAVEVQIVNPKAEPNGLQEPPAVVPPQSVEVENQKSPTPSSLTSTAEDTPESSSVTPAPSLPNVKSTDDSEESSTDSGVESTTPTEANSPTTTSTNPKSPSLPSVPSLKK